MKINEIRKMGMDEIFKKLESFQKEYFEKHFQSGLSKLKDTSVIRKIRKNIARLKTVIREQKNK
ncbi:50S ribosomal protein L29 [Candidatus Phytoplasma citri]|uniref:Large ribosomal subunit protein uL29 n=1 Tax=Candidatus Phytoplasma citri TaxID=180978 RepID=A0A1S9M3N8_9MOLU|nr:50S ribosomal protein L29 [Candidatus Phytoplasma aurantifolia]MDO8060160.1 50S ribosomal protein L29 [Candidatus Phytoplasma aurantifolia]MDO8078717.1 50S ribosomal protein L29 [Candidatus Phytoplasma aurantifolia]OOP59762.1 50S ribosomal protein L29 [Candidatus Phytoplasma aurantifolia]